MWGDDVGQGKGYGAFSIGIDMKPLERLAKELKKFPKEMGRAASNAVKDTVKRTERKIPSIVRTEYAIEKDVVQDHGRAVVKAGKIMPQACIRYSGHKLSLARFTTSPRVSDMAKAPARQPQRIRAKIKKSTGSKVLKAVQGRSVYIGPTGANDPAPFKIQAILFRRTGAAKVTPSKGRYRGKGIKREPVEALRSTSVPQMISNPAISKQIESYAAETMSKRVDHYVKRELDRIAKKV